MWEKEGQMTTQKWREKGKDHNLFLLIFFSVSDMFLYSWKLRYVLFFKGDDVSFFRLFIKVKVNGVRKYIMLLRKRT